MKFIDLLKLQKECLDCELIIDGKCYDCTFAFDAEMMWFTDFELKVYSEL